MTSLAIFSPKFNACLITDLLAFHAAIHNDHQQNTRHCYYGPGSIFDIEYSHKLIF